MNIFFQKPSRRWYQYTNLLLIFCGILLSITLSKFEFFHDFLIHLGNLGYFGAFIAGMLFVSMFTVSTGALILIFLTEYLNPFEIAILAAFGGVVGDLIILRFIKTKLADELEDLYDIFDKRKHLLKLLRTKYFRWSLPVIGAILMASPLPDELGIGIMGISKMNPLYFSLISFALNFLGILAVVGGAVVLR